MKRETLQYLIALLHRHWERRTWGGGGHVVIENGLRWPISGIQRSHCSRCGCLRQTNGNVNASHLRSQRRESLNLLYHDIMDTVQVIGIIAEPDETRFLAFNVQGTFRELATRIRGRKIIVLGNQMVDDALPEITSIDACIAKEVPQVVGVE